MATDETSSAASRLCAACGMCCNGVLFHTVKLQPRDSARDLAALGLKLKRKKGANYILQPCPQFRNACCAIYEARPERCRLFECQQLRRVAAGKIAEADAMATIRDVHRRVSEINALLDQAGPTDPKRPLSKRCEKVMAEPASDQETTALRAQLTHAIGELDELLDRDFRIVRETSSENEAATSAVTPF